MVKIELWSDFNCPFCYSALRNLEIALSKMANQKLLVDVTWKSFELNPLTEEANSFNAHRLIYLAKTHHLQQVMVKQLFFLKYVEGKDIADFEVLRNAGISIGLSGGEVMDLLRTDEFCSDVRKDEEEARALGITSVPYFMINREVVFAGAHSPEFLLKKILEASTFKASSMLEF